MANVVEQMRMIAATIAGENYDGVIEEWHPPGAEIMTADYHGGLDVAIPLDMGMETPVGRIIINGMHGHLINQFGLVNKRAVNMDVRGGLEAYNGTVKGIQWLMRGSVVSMPFSRIRGRASVAKMVLEISCDQYTVSINGTEHLHIDTMKRIRRVGGVDQLAELKAAIGRA